MCFLILPVHIFCLCKTDPCLQCDESRPGCQNCKAFGVFCNYDCRYSDLQLAVEGIINPKIPQTFVFSPNQTIPSMIAPSSNASYQLEKQGLELLGRFQARTALTISTAKSLRVYQNEIVKLACSVSTLSHSLASDPDFEGSASIPNACDTGIDTNA